MLNHHFCFKVSIPFSHRRALSKVTQLAHCFSAIRSSLCLPHWLQSSDWGSWMTWRWEALNRQSLRTLQWLWKQEPIWVWNSTLLNVNLLLILGAVSVTRHFCLFFKSQSLRPNCLELHCSLIQLLMLHGHVVWRLGQSNPTVDIYRGPGRTHSAKSIFSAQRVQHLLRCSPSVDNAALQRFDELLRLAVERITNSACTFRHTAASGLTAD